MPWSLLIAVLSGFLTAPLAWTAYRFLGKNGYLAMACVPLAGFVFFSSLAGHIIREGPIITMVEWVPSLNVNLGMHLDGLSLLFALLITGIGTLIIIYAGGYIGDARKAPRFLAFLLMFMSSMLGLVLADNLYAFFVFWELTSITSFLLIGFDHRRKEARRAAVQALVVTGGGGLALMAGLILLSLGTDSTTFSTLLSAGSLKDHASYTPILLLILVGAFTKSAQFPMHFWLPNAMQAPSPVSAYLHSATMVKAGIYLLLRLSPALSGTATWLFLLGGFGLVTLLSAMILALRQSDYKLILAYTTVASLGLMTALIGLGTEAAILGAVAYLAAHALFKAPLFMMAGNVIHVTGSRDIKHLSGLRKAMPISFFTALIAAASMAGLPPLMGFLAKEEAANALLNSFDGGVMTMLSLGGFMLGNAMMVAAALIVLTPFFGPLKAPKAPHMSPISMWLPSLAAVGVNVILFALVPLFGLPFVTAAADAALATSTQYQFMLWHGYSAAFAVSLVIWIFGLLIFFMRTPLAQGITLMLNTINWGPDKGFDQAMIGFSRLGFRVIHAMQTGVMRHYIFATMVLFAAALGLPFLVFPSFALPALDLASIRFFEVGVTGLIFLGALALVFARTQLAALVSMGLMGFGVALIFLIFSAPDLAFTQFMTETLSVVIVALVLTRIPLSQNVSRRAAHVLRDMIIAGLAGVFFIWILAGITSIPLNDTLTQYFNRMTVPEGHGHNIVNVILVDFRALDTLGEIAVVMIAGIGATMMIRLRPKKKAQGHQGGGSQQ